VVAAVASILPEVLCSIAFDRVAAVAAFTRNSSLRFKVLSLSSSSSAAAGTDSPMHFVSLYC
jgi:hypothetical protein